MSESSEDVGLITVLLQRLETQRLPRALALKDKVDRGELLDDFDLGFLEEVFADTSSIRPFLAQHPEYQDLAARMMHLYKEITEKALQNEKAAH
ncbi:MAG: hypothetical protein ACT4QB_04285 [Gammaproteobacteria bacterium]